VGGITHGAERQKLLQKYLPHEHDPRMAIKVF
jgi:hypothetical protein